MEKLETLKQWVRESKRIVFFGGAGVSTESGILLPQRTFNTDGTAAQAGNRQPQNQCSLILERRKDHFPQIHVISPFFGYILYILP